MVKHNGYVVFSRVAKLERLSLLSGIGSLGSHWQSLGRFSQISRIHSSLVRLVITH